MTPAFRSLLFVPGNRPERWNKALASGADAICIDLEDAVPHEAKALARAEVMAWLEQRPHEGPAIGVRFNGLSTLDGFQDVVAYAQASGRPDFIMIPKAAGAQELLQLVDVLDRRTAALWPIVESGAGLEAASAIAHAPVVSGILFGGADYSADVGCTMDWESLAYARGRLASICGGANVQLLDVPYLDVKDAEGLSATTMRVREMGFTGRACIHPDQVAAVNTVFTPTQGEIEKAEAIVEALSKANGNAALLNGRLIERPIILAAERILARAALNQGRQ